MFSVIVRSAAQRRALPALRHFSTPPPSPPQNPPPPPPTSLPSLDFQPAEPEPEKTQRTGAKSSKDSLSSIERKRRFLGRLSLGVLAVALGVQVVYLGRDWETDELKERKQTVEEAPSGRWERTKSRFWELFDLPIKKPYTLLLSMDDLIITSTWDRQQGWRTAKRPGVDYFLAYLSQFYEIVIFTTQHHYTAMPIIEKLDPYNFFITYKLFREATRSVDGKIVKDLSYLNRDLSKVILLDTHPEHVSSHPENAVIVPKWTGAPGDKGLIAMIPFLESYAGKDIPIEYAEKEAEAKQKHIEEWKSKARGLSKGEFTLSGMFGGPSESSRSPVPLTYLEQKRLEAQRQYKEEQLYIATHKDEFERLLEEDRQAMAREMSGSLWGALDAMAGKKAGAAKVDADADAKGTKVQVQ
ncbi:HAD-like domain-containing protein [Suillus subalutaceus]|uniref:HAD-like domain-containing protein n=1 Tax=Suillus subalutaceus TaxID=48586 RepID=UPI001B870C7B|nr:HAD-like domain-containing protein [Suillus subalutaceus]KAG1865503.1 HAD-like domain-containing protein [Suillus subalutaceus]